MEAAAAWLEEKQPSAESFAEYLATVLIGLQGYQPATEPELEPLKADGSIVLSKVGITFQVVCIVDSEQRPDRQFHLDREAVRQVARACRERYAGSIYGAKLAVPVEIIEVRQEVSSADWERVRALRSLFGG